MVLKGSLRAFDDICHLTENAVAAKKAHAAKTMVV